MWGGPGRGTPLRANAVPGWRTETARPPSSSLTRHGSFAHLVVDLGDIPTMNAPYGVGQASVTERTGWVRL